MQNVEELIRKLIIRLSDELDLIEYFIVSGSYVRYKQGLEKNKPNDVDILIIGKDDSRFITPLLEIANISRQAEGVYVFSDMVTQPFLDFYSREVNPDSIGVHIMYYHDFEQAVSNLHPIFFISISKEMELLLGNREKFESVVPFLEERLKSLTFRARAGLPSVIEQWYSLLVLGNRDAESTLAGREIIANNLVKFTKTIIKFIFTEILVEHKIRPVSNNWDSIYESVIQCRNQIRIPAIEDYIEILNIIRNSIDLKTEIAFDDMKEMFIKSLRFYEKALKYY